MKEPKKELTHFEILEIMALSKLTGVAPLPFDGELKSIVFTPKTPTMASFYAGLADTLRSQADCDGSGGHGPSTHRGTHELHSQIDVGMGVKGKNKKQVKMVFKGDVMFDANDGPPPPSWNGSYC